jgi:hypothetical protein
MHTVQTIRHARRLSKTTSAAVVRRTRQRLERPALVVRTPFASTACRSRIRTEAAEPNSSASYYRTMPE